MTRPRRPGPSSRVNVREFKGATSRQREDRLTTEEPLEIRLGWPGRPPARLTVTMRTPGDDFELVAGFLLAEGLLGSASEIHTIAYCTDHTIPPEERPNVVTATLPGPPRHPPANRYDGPGAGSSACGVCGARSISDALGMVHAESSAGRWRDLRVSADVLHELPDTLRREQRVFERTGGLHAAGLFDATGEPVAVREDVGRHNAVDKAVGARLLAGADPGLALLCVSGRIGFELVQKAAAAGVGVIAAVGAPTSLAVDMAERAGLCVVGFVRGGRFVAYAVPDRIGVG